MKLILYKSVGLFLLVASLLIGWLWMDYQAFLEMPLNISEEQQIIEVPPGGTLSHLALRLEKQGIISSRRYLVWYARLNGKADDIKVGEYRLTGNMNPVQLIDDLNAGKVVQYSLTIVEGWTFQQMLAEIKSHPRLEKTLTGKSASEIMQILGYTDIHPEGRFMPDTYHFPKGTRDIDFLRRAYQGMQSFLAEQWPERSIGLAVKTPDEALVLASIVEKETGLASERKAIAGVFNRRLLKRIRLQSDPTVIYGMGEKYDGNIRRRDLKRDTPYNTYRRFGLPPTPIALPGREAILAVLHPEEGDALYFVSRGDGSHHFSNTLEEHNEAVIKYQLKGRRKPFSSYKANSAQ